MNDAPWVVDEFREAAKVRESLVPYLADAARTCIAQGKPLMRALAFEWPHDAHVWEHPTQWMLGDDYLVCPVLEPGVETLRVYLPGPGEGRAWTDLWSGQPLVPGAHDVPVGVTTERGHRCPVFRRRAA